MKETITSSTILPDIEHHFRVSAGPGAGKTYWLVEHMRNVLHKSNRLGKTRKIACITYTNIAVETILKRLGTSIDHVEVSTMHSFLYKYIVKPYAYLIASEYDLNVCEMDGHEEFVLSIKKMNTWLKNHSQKENILQYYSDKQIEKYPDLRVATTKWLSSLSYHLKNNNVYIGCDIKEAYYLNNGSRKYIKKAYCELLETELIEFKKLYWQEGIIHHEDVLFFSYQLIKKYPFILEVLRKRFPYFFVDEFQDSNPIQIEILRQIGIQETIIGIIGDKAQSIYNFQGANYKQFSDFLLPSLKDYEMKDNRRSTNEIIDLLNFIRPTLKQDKYRDHSGNKPVIYIGDPIIAIKKCRIICDNSFVYSLSRRNSTSNEMKKEVSDFYNEDILESFKEKDNNSKRRRSIISSLKAVELARANKIKEAIKELHILFNRNKEIKKEAFNYIIYLLSEYNKYQAHPLTYFYEIIKNTICDKISAIRPGSEVQRFYDKTNYQQLALDVNIPDDVSFHKTIHNAKGDEFDNVLVILKEEKELDFLINPDLDNNEEHRVRYVAVSRAKDRLFICVPTLQKKKNNLLCPYFEVQDLASD